MFDFVIPFLSPINYPVSSSFFFSPRGFARGWGAPLKSRSAHSYSTLSPP